MYLKLKELRKENNYTNRDMARMLSISPAFYSQIENNRRRLTYEMSVRIANIFNLKPDMIFYDNEKKQSNI